MGTEKYISEVKTVNFPAGKVYGRLSNLKNIDKLLDPEKIKQVKDQVKDDPDIKLDNFQATEDECSFNVKPIGKIGIQIVEREPDKLIKLSGSEGIPFKVDCWLQILSVDKDSCKIKLTLHADMNPMIKMMVNKHLKEGINKIADALTKIPFD